MCSCAFSTGMGSPSSFPGPVKNATSSSKSISLQAPNKGGAALVKQKHCIVLCIYTQRNISILQDSNRYLTHPTPQVQPQLTSNSHSPNWKIEALG